jgi:hypothetical protein
MLPDAVRKAVAIDRRNLEPSSRFPSGAWTGFFLQLWLPGRHTTDMTLTFRDGHMQGHGVDRVGSFSMEGTYDATTGDCEWTKRYHGRHSVYYKGINDGHGIWGVWEIKVLFGLYVDRGGFHIWPEGMTLSEETDRTEQAVLQSMRWAYGWRPLFAQLAIVTIPALLMWALLRAGGLRQLVQDLMNLFQPY